MLSNSNVFASANALLTSSAVCFLPMAASTPSSMVCGFMLILPTPHFLSTASFSAVMVSGLPASTVTSRMPDISKLSFTVLKTLSSCCAVSTVGVPPPIYTVSRQSPSSSMSTAMSLSSPQSSSTYCGMSFAAFSTLWEVKVQYEHRLGQNGMEI